MAKGSGRVVLLLGSFLEAIALLEPGVARSAEPPAASPSSETASAEEGLSEVVVTARFKSENLQTAPIAITAVSADQIDARGYVNVADVARAAPNVNIEQAGSGFGKSAFVSIRGIGQNDFKYTFEPGVGFYIDDVYFGTVFGSR
jgi:iron complex outermembrane receptor protein